MYATGPAYYAFLIFCAQLPRVHSRPHTEEMRPALVVTVLCAMAVRAAVTQQPATPSYSFPPTLPPAQAVTVATNQSVPPVNLSYAAVNYTLEPGTGKPHYDNQLRPVTAFTIEGPQAPQYFLGLIIIPCSMVLGLLVWFVALCVADCQADVNTCTGRKRSKPHACQCCRPARRNMDVWFSLAVLFVAGAIVAWSVAIAYVSLLHQSRSGMTHAIRDVAAVFANCSELANNASVAIVESANALIYLNAHCSAEFAGADVSLESTASQLYMLAGRLAAVTDATYTTFSEALNTVSVQVDYVQDTMTACFLVVFVIQIILSAAFLLGLCAQYVCACQGGLNQTIRCASRCVFLLFGIVILLCCWAVAAGSQVVVLMNSDVCTPNAGVNIVNIAAQIYDYAPVLAFDVGSSSASVQGICALAGSGAPSVVRGLCFYQTCLPTDDLAATSEAKLTLDAAAEVFALLYAVSDSEQVVGNTMCSSVASQGAVATAEAIVSLSWVVYYMSCASLNPLLARIVFDQACGVQVAYSQALLIGIVVACAFTMAAIFVFVCCGLSGVDPAVDGAVNFRCCPARHADAAAKAAGIASGTSDDAAFGAKATDSEGQPVQAGERKVLDASRSTGEVQIV